MVANINDSYELINRPKPSNILGFIKWVYYVSPVAYFYDYEYHKEALRLTKQLWQQS